MRIYVAVTLLALGTLVAPTQAQDYGSYSRNRVYIEPYGSTYQPYQSYSSYYNGPSYPYGTNSSYYGYPSGNPWNSRWHYHPPRYHAGYWHDGHYHPGHWHAGYWHRGGHR